MNKSIVISNYRGYDINTTMNLETAETISYVTLNGAYFFSEKSTLRKSSYERAVAKIDKLLTKKK